MSDLTRYGSSALSLQSLESSVALTTPEFLKVKKDDATSKKIQIDVGKHLIDEGLLIPHKELDTKTNVVTISFEQNVSNTKLAEAYNQYFEDAIEKHTGRKAAISETINSNKDVTIDDIKAKYPEFYQKLIEKERIDESGNLIKK